MPIISKTIESIVNLYLKNYLESNNLISDQQYGFRSSRSTADVLTVITDRLSRALDFSFDSRAIALDISKVFDRGWHKGLLHKLKSYGISGKALGIIHSLLTGRKMKVVIDGQSSYSHFLNAGVPQGSLLGPTLTLSHLHK